jgi:hypothetical protein
MLSAFVIQVGSQDIRDLITDHNSFRITSVWDEKLQSSTEMYNYSEL